MTSCDYWPSLPDHILINIFGKLDYVDLFNMEGVCKKFVLVIQQNACCWAPKRKLHFGEQYLAAKAAGLKKEENEKEAHWNNKLLKTILSRLPDGYLREFTLRFKELSVEETTEWSPELKGLLFSIVHQAAPPLTAKCLLYAFRSMSNVFTNVQTLDISFVTLKDAKILVEIASAIGTRLWVLKLRKCFGHHTKALAQTQLDTFFHGCSQLRVLDISDCSLEAFNKLSFAKVTKSLVQFLASGTWISERGLVQVCLQCSKLKRLSIYLLQPMENAAMATLFSTFRRLTSLDVYTTLTTTSSTWLELEHHYIPNEKEGPLQSLQIESLRKEDRLILNFVYCFNSIRRLELGHNDLNTEELTLFSRLSNLETLSLRLCLNLDDSTLVKITAGTNKLKKISIIACSKLNDIGMISVVQNCKNLRSIEAGEQLTDRFFDSLEELLNQRHDVSTTMNDRELQQQKNCSSFKNKINGISSDEEMPDIIVVVVRNDEHRNFALDPDEQFRHTVLNAQCAQSDTQNLHPCIDYQRTVFYDGCANEEEEEEEAAFIC